MVEILKNKSKLREVKNSLKALNKEWSDLDEEVDSMRDRMECLEDDIEHLENEEFRILNNIKVNMKNNLKKSNNQSEFESKIWMSYLFTNKDEHKKDLSYVYVDEKAVYAIDGYRAIEYKHQNKNIDRDMFINPDELLNKSIDITLFKDVEEDTCGMVVAKNIIAKEFNRTTGNIFNIDGNYFIKEFLYQEIDNGRYNKYIFDLKELKIAVQKEYIEDMLFIFKDSKFNVSYSDALQPMFFYNDEIKITILPIRVHNIEKL